MSGPKKNMLICLIFAYYFYLHNCYLFVLCLLACFPFLVYLFVLLLCLFVLLFYLSLFILLLLLFGENGIL